MDEIAFELGQGDGDAEHKPTGGSFGVNVAREHLQAETALLEIADKADDVRQRTADAVEFPDDEGVTVPRDIKGSMEPGTFGRPAGTDILVDAVGHHAGLQQGIMLQVEALIGGGDPHVPDHHMFAPRLRLTSSKNIAGSRFSAIRFLDGFMREHGGCWLLMERAGAVHIKPRIVGKKIFRHGCQATCRLLTSRQLSVPFARDNDDGQQSPVSNHNGSAVRTVRRNFRRSSLYPNRSNRV
jgi:hypothetical protein